MKATPAAAATVFLALAAAPLSTSAGRVPKKADQFLSSGSFVARYQDASGRKGEQPTDVPEVAAPEINWKRIFRNSAAWVAGVFFAIIGVIVYTSRSGQQASAKEVEEEDAKSSQAGAASEVTEESPKNQQKFNYEDFLRAMVLCAAHSAGPKLTKGLRAKRAVESRVAQMTGKAKSFMMAEMKSVTGTLLREFEAEEAMLLMDWEQAAKHSFPSMSILVAGTISPIVLAIQLYFHILQILTMFIPLLCIAAWALYKDMDSVCAVPTIYVWIVCQGVLCLLLAIAHSVSAFKVYRGGLDMMRKAGESRKQVQSAKQHTDELTVSEVQQLFVSNSTLLQHGLVVEDQVRRSAAFTIVGVGTIAWVVLTLWTFVIVLGWTFFPGQIAFHPKAAGVAPADEFCGALATVFTARLSCVLAFGFMFINLLQLLQFFSQKFVDNPGYRNSMLNIARNIDRKSVGLPVAELFVRSLLLRGCADTLDHKILEAKQDCAEAERLHNAEVAKLAALDARIEACKQTADHYRQEAFSDEHEQAASQEAAATSRQIEDKVSETAIQVQHRAEGVAHKAQEQLEDLLRKLMDMIEQLKDNDAMREVLENAERMAHEYADKAQHMVEDLKDSEALQAALEKGKHSAEEAMARAAAAAEDLQHSESFRKGMAAAKDASERGMAMAQQAADDIQKSEQFQKGMAAAKDATEKGVAMAQQAAEDIQKSEQFQKGMAAAKDASEKGVAMAKQTAEDIQKSEQFQKGMAAAKDVSDEAVARASQAAEDVRQSEQFQQASAAAASASEQAQGAAKKAADKAKKKGWLNKK